MTTNNQIIENTKQYIKGKMSGESTGHDWWHILRVYNNARHLLRIEKDADSFVTEMAALLHDIADWKFNSNDEHAASRATRELLAPYPIDQVVLEHICQIVDNVSFKGAGVENKITTLEGKIVQDADRLDALGAIGIARCFAYGGHAGREIYNPEVQPTLHASFEAYKNAKSSSINHFYEKLLLLKDCMNTKAGREIAMHRHQYVEQFLEEFHEEWKGEL